MDILLFALITVCGVGVGLLSGMLGIGGGTIFVPLLNLVFGVPIVSASATSLFCIAPASLSGAFRHFRLKTVRLKAGLTMGCAGALTSTLGALASAHIPDLVIALLACAVILYSATQMVLHALRSSKSERLNRLRREPKDGEPPSKAAGQARRGEAAFSDAKLIPALAIGLVAGFLAGIVGVGGGFVIVPFSLSWLGYSMKTAAGTSLAAVGVIALPAIAAHAMLGQIWWLHGAALALGAAVGAQFGAIAASKVPDGALRAVFGALLAFAGTMLLVNNLAV
jgi:uncharacterized membrane protein YfcA